ncbi:DUF5709 domain-containing protein [Streptomyces sp. 900105755]
MSEWGLTAREAASHEDLSHLLGHEVTDLAVDVDGDGLGNATDIDGELIDDQVGCVRAGRLVGWDADGAGRLDDDYRARDVGIDGGAASVEEAAVHIVPEDER